VVAQAVSPDTTVFRYAAAGSKQAPPGLFLGRVHSRMQNQQLNFTPDHKTPGPQFRQMTRSESYDRLSQTQVIGLNTRLVTDYMPCNLFPLKSKILHRASAPTCSATGGTFWCCLDRHGQLIVSLARLQLYFPLWWRPLGASWILVCEGAAFCLEKQLSHSVLLL
jgi:hypothetical protein